MKYCLPAIAVVAFAAGEAAGPVLGPLSQASALGVLAWFVWWQNTRAIPRMQKAFQVALERLTDRWDDWEQTRHADSERLDATLRQLGAHCSAHMEQLRRATTKSDHY